MKIPEIGLGTWELWGSKCEKVVREALEIGYRHIDTAFVYENHNEVGKALQGYSREELFITTKISLGAATREITLNQIDDSDIDGSLEACCDAALNELRLDYLDLLLIHWPMRSRPQEAILAGMDRLIEKGKLRYKGVSNFTVHHLQDVLDAGITIDANQVEYHPYLNQEELLDFSKANGIQTIAYRPFGKGKIIGAEPLLDELGEQYNKTPAQVILRWLLQKGIVAIPKSGSAAHLKENLDVFDFLLTPADTGQIDRLDKGLRYCSGPWSEFDY